MSDGYVDFPPGESPFRPVVAGEVEALVNGLRAEVEGQLSVADERIGGVTAQLAENVYYDEISYEKYRDVTSSTDYFITHIPHLDSNGDIIKLKHGYQNYLMKSIVGKKVRSFGNRHVASLVTNASIWDVGTGLIKGVQIQDGVIKRDVDNGTSYTLGIK